MKVSEKQRFFNKPVGSTTDYIPTAKLAETKTTNELVLDTDSDAQYFRRLEKQGIHLNRAQLEAVRSIEGPLLILAGAGSGKTSVLVCRTGYLMEVCHVAPENILLMTFTSKAASEMKERIATLPGISTAAASRIEARTYHSFFLKILRHYGYNQQIVSSERYKQLILKQRMKAIGLADAYQPESILATLSYYKMNVCSVADMPEKTTVEKEIKRLCTYYEEWKKENNLLDFDDVLTEAYALIQRNHRLLYALQQRFQYMMIDEFQDSNLLQYQLIRLLARPHNQLCVVGDDDQTIYSFQGARNDLILGFEKQYPNVKRVILSVNYRSHAAIVGLGNELIKHNYERHKKTLLSIRTSPHVPLYCRPRSTDEEAEWVVHEIVSKVKAGTHTYQDFAILHRTANNSRAIFEQLAIEEIPFIDFGAGKNNFFYEQNTVLPVISYLRLAMNPLDWHALENILPTMYVAKEYGMQHAHNAHIQHPKQQIYEHLLTLPSLKPFQVRTIEERIGTIKRLKKMEPKKAIQFIRRRFYDQYLETDERKVATTHKEALKEQLDELEASAQRFSHVQDFLTFIKEMKSRQQIMQQAQFDTDVQAVQLMTIHKAKGLEFPTVFFIGASESIVPHVTALEPNKYEDKKMVSLIQQDAIRALEEERRLAYVAITRAKEQLYISSPSSYRGKNVAVSQFFQSVFAAENPDDKKRDKNGTAGVNRKNRIKQRQKETVKTKVLAWICTSATCNAWQRITTHEEANRLEKSCPMCGKPMEQGEKIV